MQGKTLDEWLGAEGSKVPKDILARAESAIKMVVETRISRAKEDFEALHKSERKRLELIEESKSIRPYEYWRAFDFSVDGFEINECPSCGSMGVLGGVLWEEEVSDEINENDPMTEYVEKVFSSEEFICTFCSLHLSGIRELNVAKLPDEFREIEEREREFEPDYGND